MKFSAGRYLIACSENFKSSETERKLEERCCILLHSGSKVAAVEICCPDSGRVKRDLCTGVDSLSCPPVQLNNS